MPQHQIATRNQSIVEILYHALPGIWIEVNHDISTEYNIVFTFCSIVDEVMFLVGYMFLLAFLRYGERVGQGQRCAFLRLTRRAELQLPIASRVLVKAGQRVMAGADVLAKLPHP